MKNRRKGIIGLILLSFVAIIKIYSINSERVENGYSTHFYNKISAILRYFFGWLPFSIGDIFYGFFSGWLIWNLIKGVKNILKRKFTQNGFLENGIKWLSFLMLIYIIFSCFWGINYNRLGINYQIGLESDTNVNYADLKNITFMLAERLNQTKQQLVDKKMPYPTNKALFNMVDSAYKNISDSLSFLKYTPVSIKPSLWGWLGNYTGFTGYYNPFSGESQINTTVPKFLQPFVACHEVAHQIGYAKENEANFVAYITAVNSNNKLLLYSTYFDMFNYAQQKFYLQAFIRKDSNAIKQLYVNISPEVKLDFKEMRQFFFKHNNVVEPFIRKGYSFYLKKNNQPLGIKTYDEVIAFLIAYYKKYGKV